MPMKTQSIKDECAFANICNVQVFFIRDLNEIPDVFKIILPILQTSLSITLCNIY